MQTQLVNLLQIFPSITELSYDGMGGPCLGPGPSLGKILEWFWHHSAIRYSGGGSSAILVGWVNWKLPSELQNYEKMGNYNPPPLLPPHGEAKQGVKWS